jgi:hypothetical protein
MLDGKIVAERHLGKYTSQGDVDKSREKIHSGWLVERGF